MDQTKRLDELFLGSCGTNPGRFVGGCQKSVLWIVCQTTKGLFDRVFEVKMSPIDIHDRPKAIIKKGQTVSCARVMRCIHNSSFTTMLCNIAGFRTKNVAIGASISACDPPPFVDRPVAIGTQLSFRSSILSLG
jgi:hypothetical protein